MPQRQSPHPDNELIDEASELPTPRQGGSSGGDVSRQVGTRAELHAATGKDPGVERATGKDNPAEDESKGRKTRAEFRKRR